MKNVSDLFKQYYDLAPGTTKANTPLNDATMPLNDATFPLAAGNKKMEYKVVIGELEYLNSNLYSGIELNNDLSTDDSFSIGNAISNKLTVTLKVGNETIPKWSDVSIYARYNGDIGTTEWVRFGTTFFIDERKKKKNKLNLVCYDSMLKAEQPFIQSEDVDDYPMLQTTVLNTICERIGVTFEGSINSSYTIDYPNERTMRELLMDIAASNGGNFTIVDDKLILIKPSNSEGETFKYAGFEEINDTLEFSRITMYYTDEDYFTSGDDTKDELIVRNDNATQAICDAVLAQLSTYVHRPFKLKSAYLNPIYELGDTIRVGTTDYQIWSYTLNFTGAGIRYSSVKSPGESAIEHEYPYEGQYSRQIKQRVQLNKAYFGVNISRKKGLYVKKSDDTSEATFNSEKLEMCSLVDGVMTPALYFDNVTHKFKISAEVEIESVDTLTGTVNTLTSNVNGISASVSDLEGNMSTLVGTVNSITATVSDMQGNISTLELTTTQISAAINNTKVTLTETDGVTVHNGGIKVLYGERTDFYVNSNGQLYIRGVLCSGNIALIDNKIWFNATMSQDGTISTSGGSISQENGVFYIGSAVFEQNTVIRNSRLSYTLNYLNWTHEFNATISTPAIKIEGKSFNTAKRFADLQNDDYVLVA